MAENTERMLPHDLNAEAAVLSAMMIDNYSVSKAIEFVQENHFYKTAHRIIFQCITELFNENIEVDIITLIHKLEETAQLTQVGGKAYINELSDIVLSSANVEYHAKIVLEKALLRSLINTSNQIIKIAYEPDRPPSEIVDWAEQKIFEIAEMPNKKTLVRISEVIGDAKKHIEETALQKTNVLGVATGFSDLDKRIGGLRPGQFVIIASRPAMGKSSFALNIAANAAHKHNNKVAIFTLEMSTDEVIYRMISSTAEVEMHTLQYGHGMDTQKMNQVTQAVIGFSDYDIYIDDTGSNTVMDIRAKSRRLKAEIKGLDLIIIDYMQLMSSKRNRENRQQEISEISRGLKVLAKELEVPVIALSQLSRKLEERGEGKDTKDGKPGKKARRPQLSDLRESGAIEQDADIVMFLYRDDYYHEDSDQKNIVEVIIGKNRHGATGTVELKFIKEFTRFENKEDPSF